MVSLTDRAKHGHAALRRRLYPRGIVFHHVPKCGGTSVGRAIRWRFFLSQATIHAGPAFRATAATLDTADRLAIREASRVFRERLLLYHLDLGVSCIAAHVRYSPVAARIHGDRYGFVTVLREPVERFLSHYRFSYRRAGGHLAIQEPLEEFLATPLARSYGAIYSDYFSGLAPGQDITTPAAVASACENLSAFAAVGFLDRLDELRERLKREFGIAPRIGHANRTPDARRRATEEIPPALLERVRDLCAPDLAVWEAMRRRWAE